MDFFLGQLPVTSSGRFCTLKVIEHGRFMVAKIKVRGEWLAHWRCRTWAAAMR
jgi:hypothetical protein